MEIVIKKLLLSDIHSDRQVQKAFIKSHNKVLHIMIYCYIMNDHYDNLWFIIMYPNSELLVMGGTSAKEQIDALNRGVRSSSNYIDVIICIWLDLVASAW